MRIGIDIDNVIADFNNGVLNAYFQHDKTLRNNGIINKKAQYIRWGMFDWSKKEEEEFYTNNIEKIVENLNVINGAKEYIDKLKSDGNKIILITGRDNGDYSNPKEMTEKWLDKNNIYYDKLVLTDAYSEEKFSKVKECKEYNVDVMVDDSRSICRELKNAGIKVYMMDTRFNKDITDIERVCSWKEIYYKIASLYQPKEIEKTNCIIRRSKVFIRRT